jgi:Kef-type K+ transport system membrane component KefB
MHGLDLFTQISLVVVLGAVVASIMRLLKQPLIIGHIITGILAGPTLFNFIHDEKGFEFLSTLGVALLLFIVGLELSTKIISRLGKVVFATTITQIGLVTVAGAVAARILHFGRLESVIIGLCLAMSSTIIIVTLLHDKRETTRLYAQIAIGVLLLQDIVATLGKIVLSAKAEGGSVLTLGLLVGRGILVIVLLYLLSKYVLPKLVRVMLSSKELLFVFSLGWALGIATLFAKIGFSVEVGALFAGVSMAGLSTSREMSSRLRPLRDFFIIIFLVNLGHTLVPGQIKGMVVPALVFSIIVFIVKPLIVLITLGIMGYTKRASFKTAITLSQISEFSLVFVVACVHGNFARPEVQAVIGLTALITFAGSAYLIKYDDELFTVLEKHLRLFERKVTKLEQKGSMQHYPVVLFGYRKGGAEFIRTFRAMKRKFVVVDYDPDAVELIERQHVNFLYGDATDVELIEELNLDTSKLVVSTISDFGTNEFLASWLKANNPTAVFVASAETAYQAAHLYSEGAAYVMMPHFIGSEKISTFIKRTGFKKSEFTKFREKHLRYLETHYSEEPA